MWCMKSPLSHGVCESPSWMNFSLPCKFIFISCVCGEGQTCVCGVCMWVCRCVPMRLCKRRSKEDLGVLPVLLFTLLLWDKVSPWTRGHLTFRIHPLLSSRLRSQACAAQAWFFYECQRFQLRSSCLCRKHSHALSHPSAKKGKAGEGRMRIRMIWFCNEMKCFCGWLEWQLECSQSSVS